MIVISYTYNYNKQPYAEDDFYSIKKAIPSLNDKSYGYLAGAAFTVPISIVGIFMVIISLSFNMIGFCFRQGEQEIHDRNCLHTLECNDCIDKSFKWARPFGSVQNSSWNI